MRRLLPFVVLLVPLMLAPLAAAFLAARFYRKARLSEAIIRTGGAGARAVVGRGIWVIPVIHCFEILDLSAKRITVALEDASRHRSVTTRDNIVAHLKADLFVRVNPTCEDILTVAQSVGCDTMADSEALSSLLEPQFAAAIQRVAQRYSFDEIQRDVDAFIAKLLAEIGVDFKGLVVEEGVVEYFARA